jgi:hypothetical protein
MKKNFLWVFALVLSLTASQAHAGKIKRFLFGTALVGIGIGATVIYHKGQEKEREKWLLEENIPVETKNSELERLKDLGKATWTNLASGIPINEDLRNIANDLRRSSSITVLDTSAFTFAEMGDRETALEIYKYRIFPILLEQDETDIAKYEKHYSVLLDCEPGQCVKTLYNTP